MLDAEEDVFEVVSVEGIVAVSAAVEDWEDVVGCCETLVVRAADCGLDVAKEDCWRGLEEEDGFWRGLLDWRDG